MPCPLLRQGQQKKLIGQCQPHVVHLTILRAIRPVPYPPDERKIATRPFDVTGPVRSSLAGWVAPGRRTGAADPITVGS